MVRNRSTTRRGNGRWTLAVGLILGIAPSCALAQQASPGPVEDLRYCLRSGPRDAAARTQAIQEQLARLRTLAELHQALALPEWRDLDVEAAVAAADRDQRARTIQRFELAAREILRSNDAPSRAALLALLGDLATTAREAGSHKSMAGRLARDLADLTQAADPELRMEAFRVLGKINPPLELGQAAFAAGLRNSDLAIRTAAADGLVYWMRTAARLATHRGDQSGVDATREEFVATGVTVIGLAESGLADPECAIRRRSIVAIGQAAYGLRKIVQGSRPIEAGDEPEFYRRLMDEERQVIQPLLTALEKDIGRLTECLQDSDMPTRQLAAQAVEAMTGPELHLPLRSVPGTPRALKVSPVGLHHQVPTQAGSPAPAATPVDAGNPALALAENLKDANPKARRSAMEVLESLGPEALPAAQALVVALSDSDRFVRWAAARTVGKLTPDASAAVPALGLLLKDGDVNVQLAAALALERYGAGAHAATPDLIGALHAEDAEVRVAVLKALGAIGNPGAADAVPDLTAALADPDARVRQAAADTLGKLGAVAQPAVAALRNALQDHQPAVQKAAGAALLNILHPVPKLSPEG